MTQVSSSVGALPTSPALARLVAEEHFRSLSLARRLGLALRLVMIRRAGRVRRARRAGSLGVGLSDHIRADIGLPTGYERVEPPHWYPPPFY